MDASSIRRRGPSQCERGQAGREDWMVGWMELQMYKPKPQVSLFFQFEKAMHHHESAWAAWTEPT